MAWNLKGGELSDVRRARRVTEVDAHGIAGWQGKRLVTP